MALAAAAAMVSGCSGGAQPAALPQLTITPTPTATSTPGSESAVTAVKQVVRRYYGLLNSATTVANARALSELMTTDCKCRAVARSTRDIALKHERYFGVITVRNVLPHLQAVGYADALVRYDFTRSGIRTATGREITSYGGRRDATAAFNFRLQRGRWLISSITYLDKGYLA